MPITIRALKPLLCTLFFLLPWCVAQADSYPQREISFIVPYPPGGATDTLARAVALELSDRWEVPVVVDNRAGASGNIGNTQVAKAKGDPYTLLFGINFITQAPALFENLHYDPVRDFTPISEVARSQNLIVVTDDMPVKTFEELVKRVKDNPGEYEMGNYGMGTSSHIYAEYLNKQTGMDLLHIPYPGAAPLLNALLGKQVRVAIIDAASARSQLDTGAFRVLAVTGSDRLSTQPEVPTLKELGYSGFDAYGWFGLLAPAGIDDNVRDKLSKEVSDIVQGEKTSELLTRLGLTPVGSRSDAFAEVVREDMKTWGNLIAETGITIH